MRNGVLYCILCAFVLLGGACSSAAPSATKPIPVSKPAPADKLVSDSKPVSADKPASVSKPASWSQVSRSRPEEWYKSDEACRVADNLLIYQAANGGWNKNIDMAKTLTQEQIDRIIASKEQGTTLDNGATHTQLRYMANMYAATGDAKYYDSFMKGLNYLLDAQYQSGGWPQFYPLKKGYYTHITFNDGAMIGAMRVLDGVARGIKPFDIVKDEAVKTKCKIAVQKGVDCILKCQIVVDGKKTVWCAQHDEVTFKPAKARSYELVSLSGSESVGVTRFLMDIDDPSPQVIEAVEGAVNWFNKVKITGVMEERVRDAAGKRGWNKVQVSDPNAKPTWARFYEIGTDRPIYVDRDGAAKYSIAEIGYERRNGYAWTGSWPEQVIGPKYDQWHEKLSAQNTPAKK
jgi:PelA/Pel-15E family pectate lyase